MVSATDLHVCRTSDTTPKPTLDEQKFREWWVTEYKNGESRVWDKQIHPELESWIVKESHVIEYAAIAEMQAELITKRIDYDAHQNLTRKLNEANSRIVEFEDIKKGHLKVQEDMQAENKKLREALEKIAEAERMGYGTQRTYGEMAIKALEEK
jgi:hypothetical protein